MEVTSFHNAYTQKGINNTTNNNNNGNTKYLAYTALLKPILDY